MAKRPAEPSLFDDTDDTSSSESSAPPSPPPPRGGASAPPPGDGSSAVSLHEAAQSRYLNYALSVITSRALPDVRDGLKPVQRRILYTMWQQNLTADAKHRKCAKVVGDVMGNYHPHGDAAIYETLVRMAQSFSLRYPLIDGSGNFGSLDGDAPRPCATPSAGWRGSPTKCSARSSRKRSRSGPATTARKHEPVVLPSRVPNLLVNGATGIAVGMATNIPPHNLHEMCTALVKLLDNPDLVDAAAVPLGEGAGLPDRRPHPELARRARRRSIATGSGSIRLRAHLGERADVAQRARSSTSRACPTRSTRRSSSSRSATSCSAARCRTWSTSGMSPPTTCASSWS